METNDLTAKNFEAYPDVAADIINALIHGGKQVVRRDRLLSAPTESLYQGGGTLHSQLEDVAKFETDGGTIHVMYLFANQTGTDGGMLLRKAGYTGGFYREQYDGKTQDRYPVIELVLYWGERHWRGGRSMRALFERKNLSEEEWRYIDDLRLHVWEMRRLPKEVRSLFTSDMRIVADYLAEGDTYRSTQKVIHKEALVKLIRVLSGDKNVEDTAEILREMDVREEEEITMCELFDQYTRRGMKQGISQGIKQGVKQGIEALIITCKELGADFEETAEKVRQRFGLKEDEVQANMRLYW